MLKTLGEFEEDDVYIWYKRHDPDYKGMDYAAFCDALLPFTPQYFELVS